MLHKDFWSAFFQSEKRALMSGLLAAPGLALLSFLMTSDPKQIVPVLIGSLTGYLIAVLLLLALFFLDWRNDHA